MLIDKFLSLTSFHLTPLYTEKHSFHNLVFVLTKECFSDWIFYVTKGGGRWRKTSRSPSIQIRIFLLIEPKNKEFNSEKANPFVRRGRKAAGLFREEDGRAAEG